MIQLLLFRIKLKLISCDSDDVEIATRCQRQLFSVLGATKFFGLQRYVLPFPEAWLLSGISLTSFQRRSRQSRRRT